MLKALRTPPGNLKPATIAGCVLGMMGGLALVFGLGWLGLQLMFGEALWKTVIGEVGVTNGARLCVGRGHDGDISYNYYARVRGAADVLAEWKYLGWSLKPTTRSETAATPDSRFAAIAFDCEDGRVMVIYDSNAGELWWNGGDQWGSTSKFVRAWRSLHAVNPRLPEPP